MSDHPTQQLATEDPQEPQTGAAILTDADASGLRRY